MWNYETRHLLCKFHIPPLGKKNRTALRPQKRPFPLHPRPNSMSSSPLHRSEWAPSLQPACIIRSVPHPTHFVPEVGHSMFSEMLISAYNTACCHYLEGHSLIIFYDILCFPDCNCLVMKPYYFCYRLWVFIKGTNIAVSCTWGAF